jgi:hypothetical protein
MFDCALGSALGAKLLGALPERVNLVMPRWIIVRQ